ncbi:DUF5615 family PIN-like protein [Endozoicomonas acroporae]|uniref:DUF5615 family PIN-like protein n=1 Tax=Endozoicomonas acroporae TaxID=1701104 RepID=UPI000C76687F|nr:DUF5615 family PIN-like protein [Endozoicomonas acroporae]
MLLLDENLSPRLIARIETRFPKSLHVIHASLDNSPDTELWSFAKANDLAVVSKDMDFLSMLEAFGHPPKLIRLTAGNVRPALVEGILIDNQQAIHSFLNDKSTGLLAL